MSNQLTLINGESARPSRVGLLDDHTKEVGRIGVLRARAALAEASRRAAERDAERLARRDDELARRAAAAHHSATVLEPAVPGAA